MNMTDVRKALWNAYKAEEETEHGIEGKSSEAYCELRYPTYWECDTIEDFNKPFGIMIYSYALGPSRKHYINYGTEDKEVNYYTWESPDIYTKAVQIINSWCREE